MLRPFVATLLVSALLGLAGPARPCSQAVLPPVDIALFEATLQSEILATLNDTGGEWTQLGPMPISNSEFSVALVEGLFYAVGGFLGENQDKLLIYDPETDSWSAGAPLPQPTHHAGVVALDRRVYAVGGTRAETRVQIYDPETDSWSFGADMPTERTAPAAVVLDGRIHVIGGANNINLGVAKPAHEAYDPLLDSWEALANVPSASEHVFAQAIDGRIYVAGGRNQFANTSNTWEYDPATDSWEQRAPLAQPTSGYGPALASGKMYVFGGEDILSSTVTTRSQVYDPARDAWETLEPMPIPLHGVAGGAYRGSIYLFGGAEVAASGRGSNFVLRFDPPDLGDDDPDLAPPNRPKKLKAKIRGPKKVRLRWKDKSNNESGFEIQVSVAGGPFETMAETGANARKRVIKGLAPATTYVFRVRAVNEVGASEWSNERAVTTAAS